MKHHKLLSQEHIVQTEDDFGLIDPTIEGIRGLNQLQLLVSSNSSQDGEEERLLHSATRTDPRPKESEHTP